MYLREIQLDLPYREKEEVISAVMIENNCTYEEAIKIDYNKSWKSEIRRRFELETRCIAALFIRLINKYKNNTCTKVVIDCVEKDFDKTYPIYNGAAMGIGLIKYELNYVEFFNKSDYEKKLIIVKIIKDSLYIIGKEEKWNLTPIEETIKKMEELDYNNSWVFGKKKKSLNKQYTAELCIEHNIETIEFYAVIRNKMDEIIEKKIIVKEKPSEWFYVKYLGKLVWNSDTEINLINKAGTILFTVNL